MRAEQHESDIMALIARAPWREAVTYRDTWPHEYVVVQRDGQQALLAAFCERIQRGEGVEGRFFHQPRQYLILGEYRYWTMTDCADMDPDYGDDVLNRASLFKDRRDFIIREGDTASREEGIDMAMQNLGRIERVKLRDVWPLEDKNFTRWLADNLELLGEELDMSLELCGVEVKVGGYRLDILAESIEGSDRYNVAIENQFEWTDHGHLGQLLTYAAGIEADYVVWVAEYFRAEHRATIDWLNRLNPEKVWFYGVEVRAIRISDSPPAPDFRVVVAPKEWCCGSWYPVPLNSAEDETDGEQYREFFRPLVADLRELGFEREVQRRSYSLSYQTFESGIEMPGSENLGYGASIDEEDGSSKASVYLWVQSGNDDRNRRVFNMLQTEQQPIDAEFDGALKWDNGDTWDLPYVYVDRDGSIDDPPETLEEIREWMRESLVRFKEVFNPYLENILAELEGE